MDNQTNMLLMNASKFFPEECMPAIRQTLEELGPEKASQALAIEFKDPTIALIISLVAGSLGIDRFYIGDTGMGIGKLVCFFVCGISLFWAIIDWFLIMGATKQKNYEKFMQNISYL